MTMDDFYAVFSIFVALACVILAVAGLQTNRKLRQSNAAAPAVVLITAHPDDEAMFFLPALRSFQQRGYSTYAICLSTGWFCDSALARRFVGWVECS